MALVETHLFGNHEVRVKGYKWVGKTRPSLSELGRPTGGVGFLIDNDYVDLFIEETPPAEFDHIDTKWLSMDPTNECGTPLFIGVVYAPLSSSAEAEAFYVTLRQAIAHFMRKGSVVLLGDFNARLGEITGDSDNNQNKPRFLDLVSSLNLQILNTSRIATGKWTWWTPESGRRSIIDYGLISDGLQSSTDKFIVHEMTNLGSDHCLLEVVMKVGSLRLDGKRPESGGRLKFELDEGVFNSCLLKELENWDRNMGGSASTVEATESFCQCFKIAGNRARMRSKPPVQEDSHHFEGLRRLMEKSIALRNRVSRARSSRDRRHWCGHNLRERACESCTSCKANSDLKVVGENIRRWERNAEDKRVAPVVTTLNGSWSQDVDRFFSSMKSLVDTGKPKLPTTLKNKRGQLVTSLPLRMMAWAEYFSSVGGARARLDVANIEQSVADLKHQQDNDHMCYNKPFVIEEITAARKKIKKGKAGGPDGVAANWIRAAGDKIDNFILKLFNRIWRSGDLHDEWTAFWIVPIYKKGDSQNPANYRPVALSSLLGKMFESIVDMRIRTFLRATGFIAEEQGGAQRGKGAMETLFILIEMIKSGSTLAGSPVMAFLDMSKAYDTVWRSALWLKLDRAGIKGRMWKMCTRMYERVSARVKAGQDISEAWILTDGLKQGSVLSPIFFLIFVNDLVDAMKETNGGLVVNGIALPGLLFVDDVTAVAINQVNLSALLQSCNTFAKRWGLVFNFSKSKALAWDDLDLNGWEGSVGSEVLEVVKAQRYLGVMMASAADEWNTYTKSLVSRTASKKLLLSWNGLLHHGLSPRVGLFVYTTYLRPVLEFGAQVIFLTKEKLEYLEIAHFRNVRAFLGLPKDISRCVLVRELGVMSIRARRVLLQLLFVKAILKHPSSSLIRRVWEEGYGSEGQVGAKCRFKSNLSWIGVSEEAFMVINKDEVKCLVTTADLKFHDTRGARRPRLSWYQDFKGPQVGGAWEAINSKLELKSLLMLRSNSFGLSCDNSLGPREGGVGPPACRFCRTPTKGSLLHVFFSCDSIEVDRILFFNRIRRMDPRLMQSISNHIDRRQYGGALRCLTVRGDKGVARCLVAFAVAIHQLVRG
jgi:hypothetical protein